MRRGSRLSLARVGGIGGAPRRGHGVPGLLRVRPQAAQPRRHGGRAGDGGLRRLPVRDVAAGRAAQRRARAAREAAAPPC